MSIMAWDLLPFFVSPDQRIYTVFSLPGLPQSSVAGTCGILVPVPLWLHLPGDGADDSKLREQGNALWALELRGRAGKMVDATQADFRFLWLQDHDIALHRGNGDTGLFIETPETQKQFYSQGGYFRGKHNYTQ